MNLFDDFKFTLRALAKRPTYTLVTLFVLALAIGANATVFSVFNGFFLKPLPYPDDDRLVMVYNAYPKMGLMEAGTSIPDYLDRRAEAPSLESLAIWTFTQRTLGLPGAPEQIPVPRVSPSMFDVLGVAPLLGRTFTEQEAELGNDQVVVLSHTLWQTRFGARADIVGTEVRLNGAPHTVVGVMPPEFGFPTRNVRAWVPFAFTQAQMTDVERGNEFSQSIGRLRPGATVEGLQNEFDAIVRRNVERLGPDGQQFVELTGFTGQVKPLREHAVGNLQQMLLVLQASVFAVLLIACANVANLQLARIAGRRKELTVRAVLGAGQRRLAGMVLMESLVLAAVGALAGLALAHFGLELVRALGLDRASQGFVFALDARVVGFTAGAALLAAVISGVVPVFVLLRDKLAQAIQEAGRLGGGGRATQAFRNGLVVVQIAMSVALLVGAGLLTKSFYQLQQEGAGFDTDSVLTARLALPASRYGDEAARGRFYEQALDELRAQPGVTHAGLTSVLPFTGGNSQGSVNVDGFTPPEGTPPPHAQIRTVNDDYFTALGINVVQGRNFAARETDRVVIVDQNMARRFWPDGNVIGQRVQRSNDPDDVWYTVIGVVPAAKHSSMTENPTKETIYWHYLQRPELMSVFVLRTTLPPEQVARAAGQAVLAIDPELPLYDVMSLDRRVMDSMGPQRTPMVLTLVFAAVAFILAVVGVYGVLTWAVTQRFGEIGVRMALGARGTDIVRLVIGQGGRLTALGLVIGVVVAVALARAMSSQIHAVSALDPMVFGSVVAGLALSALLASWIPARRAGRIDPMNALRTE